VIKNGNTVVDLSAGVLGPVDPRPVTPHSLFPLLDLTQVLEALVAIRALDSGALDVTAPLSRSWPAFATSADQHTTGADSRDAVTLAHVLSHTATGLEDAIPPTTSYRRLVDSVAMKASVLSCEVHAPQVLPPSRSSKQPVFGQGASELYQGSYHTFSHGWCVRGVVDAIAVDEKASTQHTSFVERMVDQVVEPGLVGRDGMTADEVVYGGLNVDQAKTAATLEIGFAAMLRASLMSGDGAAAMMGPSASSPQQQEQQEQQQQEGVSGGADQRMKENKKTKMKALDRKTTSSALGPETAVARDANKQVSVVVVPCY
jgi:hypothetical protein